MKEETQNLVNDLKKKIKNVNLFEGITIGALALLIGSLGLTVHNLLSAEAVINSFVTFLVFSALGATISYVVVSPFFKKIKDNLSNDFAQNESKIMEEKNNLELLNNAKTIAKTKEEEKVFASQTITTEPNKNNQNYTLKRSLKRN